MTIVIELPDEQAAALKAKAAASGLTLEGWLQKLARQEATASSRRSRYRLSELLSQCDPTAQISAEDCSWLDDPPVGNEVL